MIGSAESSGLSRFSAARRPSSNWSALISEPDKLDGRIARPDHQSDLLLPPPPPPLWLIHPLRSEDERAIINWAMNLLVLNQLTCFGYGCSDGRAAATCLV